MSYSHTNMLLYNYTLIPSNTSMIHVYRFCSFCFRLLQLPVLVTGVVKCHSAFSHSLASYIVESACQYHLSNREFSFRKLVSCRHQLEWWPCNDDAFLFLVFSVLICKVSVQTFLSEVQGQLIFLYLVIFILMSCLELPKKSSTNFQDVLYLNGTPVSSLWLCYFYHLKNCSHAANHHSALHVANHVGCCLWMWGHGELDEYVSENCGLG